MKKNRIALAAAVLGGPAAVWAATKIVSAIHSHANQIK